MKQSKYVYSVLVTAAVLLTGCTGSVTKDASTINQMTSPPETPITTQDQNNQDLKEEPSTAVSSQPESTPNIDEVLAIEAFIKDKQPKLGNDIPKALNRYAKFSSQVRDQLKALAIEYPKESGNLENSIAKWSTLKKRSEKASTKEASFSTLMSLYDVRLLSGACAVDATSEALSKLGGTLRLEYNASVASQYGTTPEVNRLCGLEFDNGFPKLLSRTNVSAITPNGFEDWVLLKNISEDTLIAISPSLFVPYNGQQMPWYEIVTGPWFGKCAEYFKWSSLIGHSPVGDDGICW